jgi:phage terminase large subunit-like protein
MLSPQLLDSLPPKTLLAVQARLIKEAQRRSERNRLLAYQPYAKQREFHAAGSHARERLLMAGNQLGKSYSGAAEMAMHATGRYPSWWQGRRFEAPPRAWIGGESSEAIRDTTQKLLLGPPEDEDAWGTGLIPADAIVDVNRRQGIADAVDNIVVKHASGKNSAIGFKSYDQKRRKWQGASQDIVWFDEEPPMDIYMEGLTRTNATGGMVYLTFTPLLGMSEVVRMFLGSENATRDPDDDQ